MVKLKQIEDVTAQIVEQFDPERVVLFGSYVYGKPHRGSDVDLLVVMPYRGHSAEKAAQIAIQIDSPLPIELLVRSPSEIRRRLKWNDMFLKEILGRGKVLYESNHGRVICRRQTCT